MTRPARFSAPELTRAAKALEKAGLHVAEARIERDGTIRLLTGANEAANDTGNPLDRLHG